MTTDWNKRVLVVDDCGLGLYFDFENMSFRMKKWGKFIKDMEISIYQVKKKKYVKYRQVDRDFTRGPWCHFSDEVQERILEAHFQWVLDREIERMLQ